MYLRMGAVGLFLVVLAACQGVKSSIPVSTGHIQLEDTAPVNREDIPSPISLSPALPIPKPQKTEPTHTVIVNDVPVEELLFSLARDASLNFDIGTDVSGLVTINAVSQPLEAILSRVSESAGLTYDIKNSVLRVRKDKPFLRNYRVDYINMSRSSESSATVSTQISATGQGAGDSSSGGGNSV